MKKVHLLTKKMRNLGDENATAEGSENSDGANKNESGENSTENASETNNAEGSNSEENNSENKSEESNSSNTNGQAQDIYTVDNYKKSKDIIEKRLNTAGIEQYTIRLDENSGSIVLEIPNDVDNSVIQNLFVVGKIEMKITETDEQIADYKSISKVDVSVDDTYRNYGGGSLVRMDIKFNNDAVKKFKEMKDNYEVPKDEDGKENENHIQLSIDGTNIFSDDGLTETSFLASAVNGSLPMTIGRATTDSKTLEETLKEANSRKALIENGDLPMKFSVKYANDVHSNITESTVVKVFVGIVAVMFVYLLFRYKLKGLLSELSVLGFGALLLLVVRYAKVEVSVGALVAMAGLLVVQFIYLVRLLNNKKINSKVFTAETIEFSKILIPACIMAVVIAFANITEISGFGMVMFWGLIIFEVFNNIITRAVLTNGKNK